jgi:hypothetical protein
MLTVCGREVDKIRPVLSEERVVRKIGTETT